MAPVGTDQLHHKVGAVQYPLTASLANPLLQDADPPLFYLLDFLSSMVTTLIGDRLLAQASAAPAPITSAVAYQLPYDPAPYLQTVQDKMPLLAVYRRKSTFEMKTVLQWHRLGEFGITYVLPPLTAGQAEQVLPILHAVGDAIVSVVESGYYPTYTPPGGDIGQSAWELSGLSQVGITEEHYGMFPAAGDLVFPAWTATIALREQRAKPTGYDAFGALDANEDLVSSTDQSKVVDFVQDKSDVAEPTGGYSNPPVIDSVTPATGVAAGGTTVTLRGSNFFTGLAVSFDGIAATSVVITDTHTLTCHTPAHAAGVVHVAVVNLSGTTGFKLNAFTYT